MAHQNSILDDLFRQEFIDEFWPKWPVKKAKLEAERAYIKARKGDKFGRVPSRSKESIMAALAVFRVEVSRTDPRYIPRAATWLNQGRDLDELPLAAAPKKEPIVNPGWNGHTRDLERLLRRPMGDLWPLSDAVPVFQGDVLVEIRAGAKFKASEIRRKYGIELEERYPGLKIEV